MTKSPTALNPASDTSYYSLCVVFYALYFDLIVCCGTENVFLNEDKLWVRLLKNIPIDVMIEDNMTI